MTCRMKVGTIMVFNPVRCKSKIYAKVFSSFYKYTKSYAESLMMNGMPVSGHGPFLYPMIVTYPPDLKAIWTTPGVFCHFCSATQHNSVSWKEGSKHCDK